MELFCAWRVALRAILLDAVQLLASWACQPNSGSGKQHYGLLKASPRRSQSGSLTLDTTLPNATNSSAKNPKPNRGLP